MPCLSTPLTQTSPSSSGYCIHPGSPFTHPANLGSWGPLNPAGTHRTMRHQASPPLLEALPDSPLISRSRREQGPISAQYRNWPPLPLEGTADLSESPTGYGTKATLQSLSSLSILVLAHSIPRRTECGFPIPSISPILQFLHPQLSLFLSLPSCSFYYQPSMYQAYD